MDSARLKSIEERAAGRTPVAGRNGFVRACSPATRQRPHRAWGHGTRAVRTIRETERHRIETAPHIPAEALEQVTHVLRELHEFESQRTSHAPPQVASRGFDPTGR